MPGSGASGSRFLGSAHNSALKTVVVATGGAAMVAAMGVAVGATEGATEGVAVPFVIVGCLSMAGE